MADLVFSGRMPVAGGSPQGLVGAVGEETHAGAAILGFLLAPTAVALGTGLAIPPRTSPKTSSNILLGTNSVAALAAWQASDKLEDPAARSFARGAMWGRS